MLQIKQSEWFEQWTMFQDEELSLFFDRVYPITFEDFRDKDMLECGYGGGQHTLFIVSYARIITAVDIIQKIICDLIHN